MLILTRSQGETICIGDDIRITVLGTNTSLKKTGISVKLYRLA